MDSPFSEFYSVNDTSKASHLLRTWFGLEDDSSPKSLPPFPLEVPIRWQQYAQQAWSMRVLQDGPSFFEDIFYSLLPVSLKQIAAETLYRFMMSNRACLSAENCSLIEKYLDPYSRNELAAALPPLMPDALPTTVSSISEWFVQSYLPYRQWCLQHGSDQHQYHLDKLGLDFAKWCLDFYPSALAGGAGVQHLAMHQGGKIRDSRSEWVTIWVVLDGLNYADSTLLTKYIEEEPRLSCTQSQVVVSTLPTITVFCKNSLIWGLPSDALPSDSSSAPKDTIVISENKDEDAFRVLGNVSLGDIVLWKISEPDKSYHKSQDRSTLLANAHGELKTFANRLKAAIKYVGNSLPLRVVISTDHGRLLGTSERKYAVPDGMVSEGRAAHGNIKPVAEVSSTSGYNTNDKRIVCLEKNRFRLPESCCVILDSGAFYKNDGSQGSVEFAHGGLYPEEVLIPWIEFARDAILPQVKSEVVGTGVAGTSDTMSIFVTNPGYMTLKVRRFMLSIDGTERSVILDGIVDGMTKQELNVEWEDWPSKSQIASVSGVLWLETLSGQHIEVPTAITLESRELYSSSFDGDDLLNL